VEDHRFHQHSVRSDDYKIAIVASMLSTHEKKQIITGSFRDNGLVESRFH